MKIDLNAQVTFADVTSGVRRFFRWWCAELFALVPDDWRVRYAQWQRRWSLVEDGTHWTIAGDELPSFAFDAALDAFTLREAFAQDAPELYAHPLDVTLAPDEVLIRRIDLPTAATSRLRSTLGLQIERLSPFRAEDVGFDCRIAERDTAERKATAEICIVPRKTMQRFEDRLHALGLSADWFVVDGTPFRIRADAGAARDAGHRRLTIMAAGAAVMLWLSVAVFTPVARDLDTEALREQIAALKPQAERALALKAEFNALRQPARLAAMKAAQARPIDVLKSLTAVLPDTVRIVDLTIEGRRVALTGIAKGAPGLIAILEKSGRFQKVHFRRPVTRRPDSNDHFEIEMTVAPAAARPPRTT